MPEPNPTPPSPAATAALQAAFGPATPGAGPRDFRFRVYCRPRHEMVYRLLPRRDGRWGGGALAMAHPDPKELKAWIALALLGGSPPRCWEVLRAWREAVEHGRVTKSLPPALRPFAEEAWAAHREQQSDPPGLRDEMAAAPWTERPRAIARQVVSRPRSPRRAGRRQDTGPPPRGRSRSPERNR